MSEDTSETFHCRDCGEEIRAESRVCKSCGHYQSAWRNFTNEFGQLIAFAMLILALVTYIQSRSERVAAENAAREAKQARADIGRAARTFAELTIFADSHQAMGGDPHMAQRTTFVESKTQELLFALRLTNAPTHLSVLRAYKSYVESKGIQFNANLWDEFMEFYEKKHFPNP